MTTSTQRALAHLKQIKPTDGWSVEKSGGKVRLLRRGIPLTEEYFLYLLDDAQGIVGMMDASRGKVLVDVNGTPTRRQRIVTVTSSTSRQASFSTSTRQPSIAAAEPIDNGQLFTYALYFIGFLVVSKILMSAMFVVYILVLPGVYLMAVQQCPSQESFDAKKELKRVMRGHHLPENDPNKPKGFWNETMARLSASATTELATGLGYEISIMNVIGAAWLVTVRVPALNRDVYWVGAFQRWNYVFQREIPQENKYD